jgi:hypothetical protein
MNPNGGSEEENGKEERKEQEG